PSVVADRHGHGLRPVAREPAGPTTSAGATGDAVDGRDRPDARRGADAAEQPALDGRPRGVVRVRGPPRIARPAAGEDRGGREAGAEPASAAAHHDPDRILAAGASRIATA